MQKNIRRVPQRVLDKISAFDQDDVIVAAVKLLRREDVAAYSHLGLRLDGDNLVTPETAPPHPSAGRYSRTNVEGMEIKRKDLPMVAKDFVVETPNFGDWSRGSHLMVWSRDVYQTDFVPPKEVTLSVTVLMARDDTFTVKFAIDEPLNRRTKNFESALLFNLNLLQESVGAVDVFPNAASLQEFAASVSVAWQILPPGTVDEVIRGMLKGKPRVTPEQEKTMRERIGVLGKLKPEAYITGSDKFLRYFGAKFGDDFVAFENVKYGNAIYLMYDDWKALSQRSRLELLAGSRDSFERIIHRDGWQDTLAHRVKTYRASKK
jgi:hypothetical protein